MISFIRGDTVPQFIIIEIRLDVCYLNVRLLRVEFRQFNLSGVFDHDEVIDPVLIGVEVLESVSDFGKFCEDWFFVDELFSVQVSKPRPIKPALKYVPNTLFPWRFSIFSKALKSFL